MSQEIIKFNVGGIHYEVSRSLLNAHPETMLAKSASKPWHKEPSDEIFIERDGERFRYILDYLRDCQVYLPVSVSKQALLLDFEYYGFEDVKEENLDDKAATTFLYGKCTLLIQDLIKSWEEDLGKQRSVIDMIEDSLTILNTFIKNQSLILGCLQRNGKSFLSCNEFLKSAGIRVSKEECVGYDQSKQKPICYVTIEIIV